MAIYIRFTNTAKAIFNRFQEFFFQDGSWSGAFGYIYNDTLDTVCLMAQRNDMRAMDFDFTSVIYQANMRPFA